MLIFRLRSTNGKGFTCVDAQKTHRLSSTVQRSVFVPVSLSLPLLNYADM